MTNPHRKPQRKQRQPLFTISQSQLEEPLLKLSVSFTTWHALFQLPLSFHPRYQLKRRGGDVDYRLFLFYFTRSDLLNMVTRRVEWRQLRHGREF
jgi:hypothetical protein